MKPLRYCSLVPVRPRKIGRAPFRLACLVALCLTGWSRTGAAKDWVAELSSTNTDTRRVAVDRIQTLDDPRIPEACLPLLQDAGYSIRRQAARAIGSRYDQIPKARLPVFIAALRKCRQDLPAGSEPWDLDANHLVADRGIGLLTRDFSSGAFSVSPDKNWVLYEQRRLPMIADTKLTTRELLAPMAPPGLPYARAADHVDHGQLIDDDTKGMQPIRLLKLMSTSEPVSDLFRPHWNPASTGLVLQPSIQAKFFSPLCLWRASDGAYRTFATESFHPLYGTRFPHWGTVLDFVRWDGPRAILKIYDCDYGGEGPYDPTGILVSVDIRDWSIALVKNSDALREEHGKDPNISIIPINDYRNKYRLTVKPWSRYADCNTSPSSIQSHAPIHCRHLYRDPIAAIMLQSAKGRATCQSRTHAGYTANVYLQSRVESATDDLNVSGKQCQTAG